jgi:hypothetical protein
VTQPASPEGAAALHRLFRRGHADRAIRRLRLRGDYRRADLHLGLCAVPFLPETAGKPLPEKI